MRFMSLDAWRVIAITLVIFNHLPIDSMFYHSPIVRHATIGLFFFFLLSGFVITHAYGGRLETAAGIRDFMIRRVGRLFPLHWVLLAVLVLLEFVKLVLVMKGVKSGEPPFAGANDIPSLIAGIFMLQAIIPFPTYTWNGPSWSLSTEFYTYVLFCAVIFATGKRSVLPSILIAVISGAILTVLTTRFPHLEQTQFRGLALCVYCFFIGHVAYKVFIRLPTPSRTLATVLELASLILVSAFFWYDPLIAVVSVPIMTAPILVFAFDKGFFSKIFANRAILYLADISYSLYMVHFVLIAILGGIARVLQTVFHIKFYQQVGPDLMIHFGSPALMDFLALMFLPLLVVVSGLTYRFIEKPGQRYFAGIARREHVKAPLRAEPAAP